MSKWIIGTVGTLAIAGGSLLAYPGAEGMHLAGLVLIIAGLRCVVFVYAHALEDRTMNRIDRETFDRVHQALALRMCGPRRPEPQVSDPVMAYVELLNRELFGEREAA